MSEEKSAQGGKVIDGTVGAQAGAAGVSVNQGETFMVREITHRRNRFDPSNGNIVGQDTLIESEVTGGTPPKGFHRFRGVGRLRADIKTPQGVQPHEEGYNFIVGGETIEDAWACFDEYAARGAEVAKADFTRRYAEFEKRLREQILVPQGPAAQRILDQSGRPLGG